MEESNFEEERLIYDPGDNQDDPLIEQKIEEVLSAFPLDEIPGDISNSDWWKCLCAIKHSCRIGYGYDLALEWSQKGSRFDEGDFDKTWTSINENYAYKKPTIGTIIHCSLPRVWITCSSVG